MTMKTLLWIAHIGLLGVVLVGALVYFDFVSDDWFRLLPRWGQFALFACTLILFLGTILGDIWEFIQRRRALSRSLR